MVEQKINDLLLQKFEEEEFQDCFLVETKLNVKNNTLRVFMDSDGGLEISKCQRLSRYLESYLDEEQWLGEKYTLEVSSPGLDQPLKIVRQYRKNIGRGLTVKLLDGEVRKGTLKAVEETAIHLEELHITKQGKKKIKELRTAIIPIEKIDKAKVQIVFK